MALNWQLDILGKVLAPARGREIFALMGFSEEMTNFFILRFWNNGGRFRGEEAGPEFTEEFQRQMMPHWDNQVAGWLAGNINALTERERESFYHLLFTGKPYREKGRGKG